MRVRCRFGEASMGSPPSSTELAVFCRFTVGPSERNKPTFFSTTDASLTSLAVQQQRLVYLRLLCDMDKSVVVRKEKNALSTGLDQVVKKNL